MVRLMLKVLPEKNAYTRWIRTPNELRITSSVERSPLDLATMFPLFMPGNKEATMLRRGGYTIRDPGTYKENGNGQCRISQ